MGKDGSVCYDVTSISSYAQEIPAVERGYNRDGENLTQFNLGMFCDEQSKIPIYYALYNGSLTDKTNLSYVLANAKAVGISRVKMVLDGGFWSKECLNSLQVYCETFTIGMPAHLKEAEAVLESCGDMVEHYSNELSLRHVYCKTIDAQINGIDGRVCLFCDAWNHLNLCQEISEHVSRISAELAALKRYPKNKLSRYSDYFIITAHKNDSGFDYVIDVEKIENLRKRKGFFFIFTTDRASFPADILACYRAKAQPRSCSRRSK